MKIGRNKNGLRIVSVSNEDLKYGRGFSIQTNGNLINTHRLDLGVVKKSDRAMVFRELSEHLLRIGDMKRLAQLK